MKARAVAMVMLLCAPLAHANLDAISSSDATAGLRAALEKGAVAAVNLLGRTDGFFGNDKVKIPLPDSLSRYESLMRRVGMGRYADELILTMNRAAEAAVPEAKRLLVDAVKNMSVSDAKRILTGGNTAGTDYFRRATSERLRLRFLPIVERATQRVKLAQVYEKYAQQGVQFGIISKENADLDAYVTQEALDGLFYMIAEEEKKIRRDPVVAGSAIIKKVFGAMR